MSSEMLSKLTIKEESIVHPGERVDDLECNGFRIIQNPSFFCFGMDAILLSDFAYSGDRDKYCGEKWDQEEKDKGPKIYKKQVCDFCTGTGILPMLLLAKGKAGNVTGLEIQEPVAEMAGRSVKLNHVEDRCQIFGGEKGDIRKIRSNFRPEIFHAVTCNPPYIQDAGGLTNPSDTLNISRHEVEMELEDVIAGAQYLLKQGGSLTMVHKPFRLSDMISLMKKYHLEPKRMRMVQPSEGKEPNMVLIEAVKGGKSYLKVLPSLNVYDKDGNYTKEVLKIYGML